MQGEALRAQPASRSPALLTALLALAIVALGAADARAELTQKGDLFVRFGGGITPKALPRNSAAPIAVRIEGTIRALGRSHPPALRRIRIALNRAGQLETRGLPRCPRARLRSSDTAQALAECGSALVGSGGITAVTSYPEQPPYLMRAEVLLFNAVAGGRRAILAHVFQRDPAPSTRVVVFHIRRGHGAFGTVLEATLPPGVNRDGYVKTIYLQLQRLYMYRGERRSYLSASCSTPSGVPAAVFPFADASMTFDDGRTLSATLIRSCRVSR